MSGRSSKRVSTVVAMASAFVLAMSSGAWANWSSTINSWTDGGGSNGQSRYWADQSYSETFTNCFDGSTYASRGEYTGLPEESDYFFQLDNVGGGSNACCLLWATYAGVDTTLEDA
ncbi:hypothetical protein [Streptomyces sp. Tue6028]|uniref:hypothetical protein n=3 Tax=Streptomyces sp. Tue6028 TaxID=2036037 RepID=UPI003EBCDB33